MKRDGAMLCGCFDGCYPVEEIDLTGRVTGGEPIALRCWRHRDVPAAVQGVPVRLLEEARIARLLPPPPPLAMRRPVQTRRPKPKPKPSTRARTRTRRRG